MKANEIQVGDYFRVAKDGLCIKKDSIVEIRAIDADDKLESKNLIGAAHCRPMDKDQFEGGIWLEYLDPIPLTPEILEKNGFKEILFDENGKESDNGHPSEIYRYDTARSGYIIELGIYSPNCICIQWKEFGIDGWETGELASFVKEDGSNYMVHELQHALRLCRIEKEIKL